MSSRSIIKLGVSYNNDKYPPTLIVTYSKHSKATARKQILLSLLAIGLFNSNLTANKFEWQV